MNEYRVCEMCNNTRKDCMSLKIEDTIYDFCSYSCLLNFIVCELKKLPQKENSNETIN